MDATPDIGEGQRQTLISNIQEVDKRSFADWVNVPRHQRSLDLPRPALRHLLISPRVLELAEDPSQVGVIVEGQTSNTVDAFVVEHRPAPITNRDSLDRFIQQREEYHNELRAKSSPTRSGLVLIPEGGGPQLSLLMLILFM